MADLGASVLDLMAWYRWNTPSEPIHYVETNKRKGAKQMAAKVEEIEEQKGGASVKPEMLV